MKNLVGVLCVLLSGACVLDPGEPGLGRDEQAAYSYQPLGFARVTAAAGVVTSFNKGGGTVTATRTSAGTYRVDFPGLGSTAFGDAWFGNAQIVAEGTNSVRCQLDSVVSVAPALTVLVDCFAATGARADTAFAVEYHRYAMPAPNSRPAYHAYSLVAYNGHVANLLDYNASGVHNSVARTAAGRYTVNITNATALNASIMLTPADRDQPGNVCAVTYWTSGTIYVECRDRTGAYEDTGFSISYAVSGPTIDQQGAHAWFNGIVASPTYSAALGKVSWCSPASVTGSRSGSLATMVVSGDLGSWDAAPFVHTGFASKYGSAGYCKVESSTASGSAPSWTGTTTVRCYDPAGAVVATPQFTFTDVTNNPTGPC